MWKTTDRYVQQKRLKAAEAESKLKQVSVNKVFIAIVGHSFAAFVPNFEDEALKQ